MPLIAVEALTKRFTGVTALDGLTFTVEPGVIGLVGANGAGKSTLIKILLGLLLPTNGRATVLDRQVATRDTTIRARVGYMPEHECLPPDVSATELVVHMARLSGLPPTAARERTADTLRHVGLHEARYRPMEGYSTGMRQRVKLAQSLVHDPRLIFLDEPTNGLDPAGRDEMLDLIRRIGTDFGISVLVSSHLLGELERTCDHIVIIDGGRLLRSQPMTTFTQGSGVLAIEVEGGGDGYMDRDLLGERLGAAGLRVHAEGRLLLADIRDEYTYDLVRDQVAGLGLSMIRMEQRRHRVEDVFVEPVGGAPVG